MWNKEFFKADNIITHRSFTLLQGVINKVFPYTLVNIYAPNDVVNRRIYVVGRVVRPEIKLFGTVVYWGRF